MTKITRTAAALIIAACAITFNASAQTVSADAKSTKIPQEKVLNNFRASLKSDYHGVVEGTIYNIVVYKKYFPGLDYAPVLSLLNKSAQMSDDASLRYKAHLAAMYLTDESGITLTPVEHPADHEYIFRQIAKQLEEKLLVTN